MAAPEIEAEPDDDGEELGDAGGDTPGEQGSLDGAAEMAGSADPTDQEEDPDVAEVDLSDDDLGGGGADGDLFTGTDDAGDTDSDDGDGDDSDDSDVLDGLDERGESMETAINEGAARLAVVGMDDEEAAEDLEAEFGDVFSAFRLGYFGSQFAEEYVLAPEEDEVDPTWGLLGAVLVCSAMVVWRRPDGDDMVGGLKEAVGNIVGGDA